MEKPADEDHSRDETQMDSDQEPESLGAGEQAGGPLEGPLLRPMEADPFPEMHAYMHELFTAVLEVAAPDLEPVESAVCRRHQLLDQPAAQLTEQSRKELSPGEVSGATPSDRAESSKSHSKEDLDYQQLSEILATLKANKYFVHLGHLGSESDVSGGEAGGQMQKEREEFSVQSSSLSKEVSLDFNRQISKKLQELQAVCKELEDLLHMRVLSKPDQVGASGEMKSEAHTGSAEGEPHMEQGGMIEPCDLRDPKSEESTVSKSQIKEQSDGEKTKFDASRLHGIPIPYVYDHLAWKLYKTGHQLQVMCENVSSILLNSLDTFVVGGIKYPDAARRCLHLGEVACVLIGCSSQLRSAVGQIMNIIWGCKIKENAYLIFTFKKLTAIFPLLETACQNLYTGCLQLQPPSDCRKDPGTDKSEQAEARRKVDRICQQMDVADEQLEKAIQKLNIMHDNEAAAPEIPAFPLQPETESQQGNSKEINFTIANKLLLIEEQISSLLEARTLQGQEE